MKILYIGDRQNGGIVSHVHTLRHSLPQDVVSYEIGLGGDEEFAGRNGHDPREWFQIRRVIRTLKPDIIHFHIPALMMCLYARLFAKVPIARSWHTSTTGREGFRNRMLRWLFGRKCYYLPVSRPVWDGLRRWSPHIRGEVFFNPIRLGDFTMPEKRRGWLSSNPVVGMVGRNAAVKDWPSFHAVERIVREEMSEVEFLNAGEEAPCEGREAISKMDLFLMTSRSEGLPTTLLECFALGTPVCGFLPDGGTSDILDFSSGPVREAFVTGRDCTVLARLVVDLLRNADRRRAIIEDGWRIVKEHFDAEKNCRGQLMGIYAKILAKTDWSDK